MFSDLCKLCFQIQNWKVQKEKWGRSWQIGQDQPYVKDLKNDFKIKRSYFYKFKYLNLKNKPSLPISESDWAAYNLLKLFSDVRFLKILSSTYDKSRVSPKNTPKQRQCYAWINLLCWTILINFKWINFISFILNWERFKSLGTNHPNKYYQKNIIRCE